MIPRANSPAIIEQNATMYKRAAAVWMRPGKTIILVNALLCHRHHRRLHDQLGTGAGINQRLSKSPRLSGPLAAERTLHAEASLVVSWALALASVKRLLRDQAKVMIAAARKKAGAWLKRFW